MLLLISLLHSPRANRHSGYYPHLTDEDTKASTSQLEAGKAPLPPSFLYGYASSTQFLSVLCQITKLGRTVLCIDVPSCLSHFLPMGLCKGQGPLAQGIRPDSDGCEVLLEENSERWKRPGLQINRDLKREKQEPCSRVDELWETTQHVLREGAIS